MRRRQLSTDVLDLADLELGPADGRPVVMFDGLDLRDAIVVGQDRGSPVDMSPK